MKTHFMYIVFTLMTCLLCISCVSPKNDTTMNTSKNPMKCDTAKAVCEIRPGEKPVDSISPVPMVNDKVKIIYYTDPICSSCWGIEPQLRRLKLEYGDVVEVEYRMGGLLPDWSYNSGGISKPSDVASHWEHASKHYGMPIDGDVWLEDPLDSSYPPSIAFKAAQIQDKAKAVLFLRSMREMLFLGKKNITKWEHLRAAAELAGLDSKRLEVDYKGVAKSLFEEDLVLGRKLGVRGFPTMFIMGAEGAIHRVYGARPYETIVKELNKVVPNYVAKKYSKEWQEMFDNYSTWTTRGYAEVAGISIAGAEESLRELEQNGMVSKVVSKNGPLWKRIVGK